MYFRPIFYFLFKSLRMYFYYTASENRVKNLYDIFCKILAN